MNDLRIPGWVRELSPHLGAKGGPPAPQPSGHQRKESRAVAVSASMPGRWRRTPEARIRAVTEPLFLPPGRPMDPTPRTGRVAGSDLPPRTRLLTLSACYGALWGPGRCRGGSDQNGPEVPPRGWYGKISESWARDPARGCLRPRKEEAEFGGQDGARGNPHSDFSLGSRLAFFPHP